MQLVEDPRRRLGRHPRLAQPVQREQRLGAIEIGESAQVEVAGPAQRVEAEPQVAVGRAPLPEVEADDAEVVVGDGAAVHVSRGLEPGERVVVAVERLGEVALRAGDGGEILLDPSAEVGVAGERGRLEEPRAGVVEALLDQVDAARRVERLRHDGVIAHRAAERLAPAAERAGEVALLPAAVHHGEPAQGLGGDAVLAGGAGRGDGGLVAGRRVLEISLAIVLAGHLQQAVRRRRARGERRLPALPAPAEGGYHATA